MSASLSSRSRGSFRQFAIPTEGKPRLQELPQPHLGRTPPGRTGMYRSGSRMASDERYCDYALDVPMYFVFRDGRYIDVAGESFRDFLEGKLPALPGEKPTLADWTDHLSTAFPEVRLKSFLEMRGADGGRWGRICALPALWVGLLYSDSALDCAWDRVKHWTIEEREALRHAVPRQALEAAVRAAAPSTTSPAKSSTSAASGLHPARQFNSAGDNESGFLDPLRAWSPAARPSRTASSTATTALERRCFSLREYSF